MISAVCMLCDMRYMRAAAAEHLGICLSSPSARISRHIAVVSLLVQYVLSGGGYGSKLLPGLAEIFVHNCALEMAWRAAALLTARCCLANASYALARDFQASGGCIQ